MKDALGVTAENPSLARKIAAGSLSGAVAAGVTNPLDLIKTRMQSKGNPDKTMMAAMRSVLTQGGVKGLWRGSAPSMVRVSLHVILAFYVSWAPLQSHSQILATATPTLGSKASTVCMCVCIHSFLRPKQPFSPHPMYPLHSACLLSMI